MGDAEPQSLRRKCQSTDSGRHVERLVLAFGRSRERSPAHRPRDCTIGMNGDIVDPAALGIRRQNLDLRLGINSNKLAVIPTGNHTLAIRGGTQNPTAVCRDRGSLALSVCEGHVLLRTDEYCNIAKE